MNWKNFLWWVLIFVNAIFVVINFPNWLSILNMFSVIVLIYDKKSFYK